MGIGIGGFMEEGLLGGGCGGGVGREEKRLGFGTDAKIAIFDQSGDLQGLINGGSFICR